MTTRQQLALGIDLVRGTIKLNKIPVGLIKILEDKVVIPEEVEIGTSAYTFNDYKEYAIRFCDIIDKLASNINTVLTNVDVAYLDESIDAILTIVNRAKISSDVGILRTLALNIKPQIQLAISKLDYFAYAIPFKQYEPQVIVKDEPNPRMLLGDAVCDANIAHDLLDAMSYELQGIDSCTGQQHNLSLEGVEKLVLNRIRTMQFYLNRLPNGIDKQTMNDVLLYMEKEFPSANTVKERFKLGTYIDEEIPKLIMVRRSWAL